MSEPTHPIGIFDSGLGGLSVYREIRKHLPAEDVLYYADSAFCPYGTRSPEEIRNRCHAISRLLIERGAKVIVVACNTATSMAIDVLRASFPEISFVGLEPAVKPAAAITRSGRVGVLATPRTVTGDRLRWLIETHASGAEVRTTPGNGLVELVEAGMLRGPDVLATVQPMLDPMLGAGVDVIVLGCTHYPFLRDEIQAYVGPDVAIIDSGAAIARRVSSVLKTQHLLNEEAGEGTFELLTSAPEAGISRVASLLLGHGVPAEQAACTPYDTPEEPERLCAVKLDWTPKVVSTGMSAPGALMTEIEPRSAAR